MGFGNGSEAISKPWAHLPVSLLDQQTYQEGDWGDLLNIATLLSQFEREGGREEKEYCDCEIWEEAEADYQ
jgi:hypothetical protein